MTSVKIFVILLLLMLYDYLGLRTQYVLKMHYFFQIQFKCYQTLSEYLQKIFKKTYKKIFTLCRNVDLHIRGLLILVTFSVKITIFVVQLERSVHRFTTFYSSQHSGRKLNWLYNMSKGELVTNCFKNRFVLHFINN